MPIESDRLATDERTVIAGLTRCQSSDCVCRRRALGPCDFAHAHFRRISGQFGPENLTQRQTDLALVRMPWKMYGQ